MLAFHPLSAWSLKTKFALCCGVLLFAFTAVLVISTLRSVRADLIVSVTDAQMALVRSTAADIDEKIEVRRRALMTTAQVLSRRLGAADQAGGIQAFFESQPTIRDMFDGMAVVDASGRFVFDTDSDGGRVGTQVVDRPYMRQVLAGASFSMSSPFRSGKGAKHVLLVFAAPLRATDGHVSGALLGSINLERANFLGRLGETRIGQGGRFTLLEKGPPAIIVMHNDKSRLLATVDPGHDVNLARSLAGFQGTVRTQAAGVDALRTSTPLHGVPWVLVAVYPTAEAFASLRAGEHRILWIAAGLCLLASYLGWLITGRLLLPLQRLQSLMANRAGSVGMPMPPADFGSAEVASLVAAYNAQAHRRQEFEDRLQASEGRLRGITDRLPALIAHLDTEQRYDFLNGTFETWLGIDPATAVGRRMVEVMSAQNYAARRECVARCLAGESVDFEWEEDLRVGRKVLRIEYLPDFGADGSVVGFYTFSFDVTALKDAQDSLNRLVRSDNLTGLHNRYEFNEFLPLAVARCARSGLALALMFLDIDHFKHINDALGHAAGDKVLQQFASRLLRAVRSGDLVARLGGDEFVVVLEGLHDDDEAQVVANLILVAMRRPFDVGGRQVDVTTSLGVAFVASAGGGARDVLAIADAALYKAKARGRDTYCIEAG